jgi:Flp pilus assembly protein TadD
LDDKPILARRPTLWQKAQRWARRHRRAVAAAAVLGATVLMLGSVGWAWLAQERTARQARMTRAALEAFQEAASLGGQAQDTPEDPSGYVAALSAAKRAHALLPDDEHDTELGRRIGELCTRLAQAEDAARTRLAEQERNWKMLRNLEQVRSLAAGVFDGQLSDADIDAEYARVFRAFGQDLESSTVETAQWIQSTKIRAELAAAVDDWAMVRQRTYKKGDETWRTLLSIALAADPDDIRVQIRDWLLRGGASDKTPRVEMVDVALLPPATVLLLAGAVVGTGDLNRAVELLREAQRAHPGDFWLNYRLAVLLHDVKPARWSEMVRFGTAALSLRPTSAAAHILLGDALRHFGNLEESIAQFRLAIELQPNHEMAHASLGNALIDRGDLEGAIAAYRRALDLKPDNAVAHSNLAIALEKLGDLDAAIDEYRRALLLRPDFLDARKYLGDALLKRGDFEGAIAECRRALELATDDAEIHNNLGLAFQAIGNLHGAIGEFRRASELKPDIAIVHTNLGLTLWAAGDKDGAIAKFRRALELKPDDATTHYSLGCYLSARGDLDDAIAEYRMALELKPDYAEANCNLGLALQAKGQFNEALALLRRGHDIGTRTKGWQYQSEQWVHQCERLVALDARLDAISSGEVKPKDAVETIEFALFCLLTKNRNVAATRFFIEAFAVEPNLERDMTAEHRYNAACAAALAASGEGEDTTSLDASDHVRLRHLALNWLKSDLAFWHEQVDDYSRQPAADSATKLRAPVLKTLQHWQADADLAGVRNAEALAKLSELEQESWRKLWADVDALIQKLQP